MRYFFIVFGLLFAVSHVSAADSNEMSFCYEEWRPYAYFDDDKQNKGIAVDFLKRKLTAANIRYQFIELPFPRCKQAVISQKIDFILHVDETDGFNLLSQKISDWQITFAVSKETVLTFDEIINSKGLRIIKARSYDYPQALEDKLVEMSANVVKVSYYTGEPSAMKRLFHRLTAGQGHAMVVDKVWAQQVIEKYQLPIKLFDQLIVSIPQYIGYNNDNQALAQRLEKAMSMPEKEVTSH